MNEFWEAITAHPTAGWALLVLLLVGAAMSLSVFLAKRKPFD